MNFILKENMYKTMLKQNQIININNLFNVKFHIGENKEKWNPLIKNYVFGFRHGVYFFNLNKTLLLLKKLIYLFKKITQYHQVFLFIGINHTVSCIVSLVAKTLKQPSITKKWVGGTLTNWLKTKPYILSFINTIANFNFMLSNLRKKINPEFVVWKLELNVNLATSYINFVKVNNLANCSSVKTNLEFARTIKAKGEVLLYKFKTGNTSDQTLEFAINCNNSCTRANLQETVSSILSTKPTNIKIILPEYLMKGEAAGSSQPAAKIMTEKIFTEEFNFYAACLGLPVSLYGLSEGFFWLKNVHPYVGVPHPEELGVVLGDFCRDISLHDLEAETAFIVRQIKISREAKILVESALEQAIANHQERLALLEKKE